MSAEAKVKAPTKAAAPAAGDEACKPTVLTDSDSRTQRLAPGEEQKADLSAMMKDMETLLARMS